MRHQSSESFAREFLAVVGRLALYFGVLAGVFVAALRLMPLAAEAVGTQPPATPRWVEAEQTRVAFDTRFPDIADREPVEIVLRDTVGGGRRDQLLFEHDGRSAMIEVYRPGHEVAELADAPEAVVERAETAGAVDELNVASAIASRFGPVSLYDFTLVQGDKRRGCLGFVRTIEDPRLQIAGWFCNPDEGMVARPRVACALDRLTLLSAGTDRNVARFFAQADLKRDDNACKRASPHGNVAAADWIDTRQQPRLRGIVRR